MTTAETFRAMDPALLIPDLDETLVYARQALDEHGYSFRTARYYVSVRPHVSEFLESVFDWFCVAVWTSAGEDYGRQVIAEVFPDPEALEFAWFSDRCTRRYDPELREHFWLKEPFLGDSGDTELLDVLPFLGWIRGERNFRAVEKRNWRTHRSTRT